MGGRNEGGGGGGKKKAVRAWVGLGWVCECGTFLGDPLGECPLSAEKGLEDREREREWQMVPSISRLARMTHSSLRLLRRARQ